MGIYVSFNDSSVDPTYANGDDVTLVESNYQEDNPCVNDVVRSAPVLPANLEELKAFASIQGWDLQFDHEGQAILYTGINK